MSLIITHIDGNSVNVNDVVTLSHGHAKLVQNATTNDHEIGYINTITPISSSVTYQIPYTAQGDDGVAEAILYVVVNPCPNPLHITSVSIVGDCNDKSEIGVLTINVSAIDAIGEFKLFINNTEIEIVSINGTATVQIDDYENDYCGQNITIKVEYPDDTNVSDTFTFAFSDCCAIELGAPTVTNCDVNGNVDISFAWDYACVLNNLLVTQITKIGAGSQQFIGVLPSAKQNTVTTQGDGKDFFITLFESPQESDKCQVSSPIFTLPNCCTCNFNIVISNITSPTTSSSCDGEITFYANVINGNCATPWQLVTFVGFSYGYILPNQNPQNPCYSNVTITGLGTQANPFKVTGIRKDFYQIKIKDSDSCSEKTQTVNVN